MKPDQYNPKAKEAFGKSLVDVGVALFKSVMLLIFIMPASIIVMSTADVTKSNISVLDILQRMPSDTFTSFIIIISLAMVMGAYIRALGLKYIHDSEN